MERENINLHDALYKARGYTWTDAVKKGKIIAISGMVSVDEKHHTLHPGDLEAQTREIYEQIKKLLEEAGATFDNVIKTVDYITPEALPNYAVTGKVRHEYFKGNFSAATGVVVNRLLRPDWLIEIDAIAVLD
jgi:enamine deaminase RidA (YjgF/YER057c/UK114 family)